MSITYYVVFLSGFSSSCVPMLTVSLDCPFLFAPSVFSYVYATAYDQCIMFIMLASIAVGSVLDYQRLQAKNYGVRIGHSSLKDASEKS